MGCLRGTTVAMNVVISHIREVLKEGKKVDWAQFIKNIKR